MYGNRQSRLANSTAVTLVPQTVLVDSRPVSVSLVIVGIQVRRLVTLTAWLSQMQQAIMVLQLATASLGSIGTRPLCSAR
jgi:hypothetical protein